MADLDERALIGALLQLPKQAVIEVRTDFERDDLDDPRLRIIVDLIDDCLSRNVQPDCAVVLAAARTSAKVPGARLSELGHLLIELASEVPIPVAVSAYAAGVIEASVRRRIKEAATRLEQASGAEFSAALTVVTDECSALTECTKRILKEKTA